MPRPSAHNDHLKDAPSRAVARVGALPLPFLPWGEVMALGAVALLLLLLAR